LKSGEKGIEGEGREQKVIDGMAEYVRRERQARTEGYTLKSGVSRT